MEPLWHTGREGHFSRRKFQSKWLNDVAGKLFFLPMTGLTATSSGNDGTSAGTTMVRDIRPGSASSSISLSNNSLVVDGIVYFTADNGSSGVELWRSDGTPKAHSY